MVELRGVQRTVNGTRILRPLDVAFRANAFNVILGPNGAGKSTLLRIATGLLRPDSGAVLYDGVPVDALSGHALARRRAVLSQHIELPFALAARDVVMMGRYPHFARVPGARDRTIVDEAIALVGMQEHAGQSYPTLSGGERQKIQLARVLAQIWPADDVDARGTVLFLDEPTASLDIHYQIHLLDVARDLAARGCTVIAVLHDINHAFRYGEKFVLLERGAVAADTEDPATITRALLERVFRVRAERFGNVWAFGRRDE